MAHIRILMADDHPIVRAGIAAALAHENAIRKAMAGKRVILPDVASRLAEFTPRIELTAREEEVLLHVAHGLGNKEIANAIGRSADTVKTRHVGSYRHSLNGGLKDPASARCVPCRE